MIEMGAAVLFFVAVYACWRMVLFASELRAKQAWELGTRIGHESACRCLEQLGMECPPYEQVKVPYPRMR